MNNIKLYNLQYDVKGCLYEEDRPHPYLNFEIYANLSSNSDALQTYLSTDPCDVITLSAHAIIDTLLTPLQLYIEPMGDDRNSVFFTRHLFPDTRIKKNIDLNFKAISRHKGWDEDKKTWHTNSELWFDTAPQYREALIKLFIDDVNNNPNSDFKPIDERALADMTNKNLLIFIGKAFDLSWGERIDDKL